MVDEAQKTLPNAAEEKKATRAEIRGRIFSSKKLNSEIVEFFGVRLELRQPTLESIIEARSANSDRAAMVGTLIKQAFIPETDELIFDDTDYEELVKLPFGPDFVRVANALEKLSNVNFRNTGTASDETTGDLPL